MCLAAEEARSRGVGRHLHGSVQRLRRVAAQTRGSGEGAQAGTGSETQEPHPRRGHLPRRPQVACAQRQPARLHAHAQGLCAPTCHMPSIYVCVCVCVMCLLKKKKMLRGL